MPGLSILDSLKSATDFPISRLYSVKHSTISGTALFRSSLRTPWVCSRATSRVEFLVGMETVPREMDCVDVGHDKAMRTAAPWS